MPKKEQGKKKQIKPKKEKKSKKPAKPKTLARAATPKTHQPCCTDVLKTGQAYAIPFGFSDLKGTTRLPATVGTAPVVGGSAPLRAPGESPPAPVPPAKKPVLTQQRKVSIAVMPSEPKTIPVKKTAEPIATQTEAPATVETGTQVQRSVYKVVKPPARPFATQTEAPATVETGMQTMIKEKKPRKLKVPEIISPLTVPTMSEEPEYFEPSASAATTRETSSVAPILKSRGSSLRFNLEQEYLELTGQMAGPDMSTAALKKKIAAIKGMTKA